MQSVSSRILLKTAMYHSSGCRDNPHQPMAPRRRGSRVPSLRSVLMQPHAVREYLFFCLWQSRSFLFGMPARGPSRPLLVGFRVAALDSVRHCEVAGGH